MTLENWERTWRSGHGLGETCSVHRGRHKVVREIPYLAVLCWYPCGYARPHKQSRTASRNAVLCGHSEIRTSLAPLGQYNCVYRYAVPPSPAAFHSAVRARAGGAGPHRPTLRSPAALARNFDPFLLLNISSRAPAIGRLEHGAAGMLGGLWSDILLLTTHRSGEDATMTHTRSADEIARLGDEIYERDIRPQVEAEHHGEYVAIDVESGCWGLSDDLRGAREQLRATQPDAADVWLLRVGHRTLHHIGGRPLRPAERLQ